MSNSNSESTNNLQLFKAFIDRIQGQVTNGSYIDNSIDDNKMWLENCAKQAAKDKVINSDDLATVEDINTISTLIKESAAQPTYQLLSKPSISLDEFKAKYNKIKKDNEIREPNYPDISECESFQAITTTLINDFLMDKVKEIGTKVSEALATNEKASHQKLINEEKAKILPQSSPKLNYHCSNLLVGVSSVIVATCKIGGNLMNQLGKQTLANKIEHIKDTIITKAGNALDKRVSKHFSKTIDNAANRLAEKNVEKNKQLNQAKKKGGMSL